MVGGGRLVKEFGGRRRRLGRGFRLGVGVKSLVGSASAWSVKGGFLLLPGYGRERKTKKVLTLLRNWRTKETVVNNTVFFTVDILLSLSWILRRTCLPLLCLFLHQLLSHLCIGVCCLCACVQVSTNKTSPWCGCVSNHFLAESSGRA